MLLQQRKYNIIQCSGWTRVLKREENSCADALACLSYDNSLHLVFYDKPRAS